MHTSVLAGENEHWYRAQFPDHSAYWASTASGTCDLMAQPGVFYASSGSLISADVTMTGESTGDCAIVYEWNGVEGETGAEVGLSQATQCDLLPNGSSGDYYSSAQGHTRCDMGCSYTYQEQNCFASEYNENGVMNLNCTGTAVYSGAACGTETGGETGGGTTTELPDVTTTGPTTTTTTTVTINNNGGNTTTTSVNTTGTGGSGGSGETDGTGETGSGESSNETTSSHTGGTSSSTTVTTTTVEEGEELTAGGGGSCESEPTCSGDAIACATLTQQWYTRCENEEVKEFLAEEFDGEFSTDGVQAAYQPIQDNLTNLTPDSAPFGAAWTDFEIPGFGGAGGGTCASVINFTLTKAGQTVDASSTLCQAINPMLEIFGWMMGVLTLITIFHMWATRGK